MTNSLANCSLKPEEFLNKLEVETEGAEGEEEALNELVKEKLENGIPDEYNEMFETMKKSELFTEEVGTHVQNILGVDTSSTEAGARSTRDFLRPMALFCMCCSSA